MGAVRPGRVGIAWAVASRPLAGGTIRRTVRAALAHGGRPRIDVDVALVSDRRLSAIHERFLGDPSPTDVISFDLGEDDGSPAGEIYVSVDRARAVARERGVAVGRELQLYLVHGALHLCGYDDRSSRDRRRMRDAEATVLASLRSRRPGSRGGVRVRTAGRTADRKIEKTSGG